MYTTSPLGPSSVSTASTSPTVVPMGVSSGTSKEKKTSVKMGALSLMSVMLTLTDALAVLVPSEDSIVSLSVDRTSRSSLLAIVKAPLK